MEVGPCGQGVEVERDAELAAGGRGWWTSLLDRGLEVSETVRCRDDIGAVRRERLPAVIPDGPL